MKTKHHSNKRRFSLAKCLGLGLGFATAGLLVPSAPATTYIWLNSNVNTTGSGTLDWFSGGANAQGAWNLAPTSGAGSNLDTYQFFTDTTTAFTNTAAVTQISNINNGGVARQLSVLSLEGLGSATTGASVTLTVSGDPLNFSGSAGTINLDALTGTGGITYNINSAIQLGTASSGSVLTLQGAGTGTFNVGGAISELQSSGGSLVKAGSSAVTLTGVSTYSGTTTVNAGTITLQGAGTAGSIVNSSGITIAQGATLALKNDATNGISTNRIGDTAAITLTGGTFNFGSSTAANSTFSETVGQLNVSSGGQNRIVTAAASGTSSSSTLTFASLNRSTGTGLTFATTTSLGAAANKIIFTSAPTVDAGGLIGGWATAGSIDFAAYDAVNGVKVATYTANTEPNWVSSDNVKLSNAGTALTGSRQINSLALASPAGTASLNLGGFTLRVQSGGILASGAGFTPSITNGTLTAGNGNNVGGELFLMSSQANTRPTTVSANITDNGTGVVSLVINGGVNGGTGGVTLSGNNTYTGTTTIAGGGSSSSIILGSSTAINNSKGLTIATGATLTLNSFTATVDGLSGNGGVATANTNGNTLSLGNGNGSATFTGTFSVGSSGRNLNIIKNGTGTQVIAGLDNRDVTTSGSPSTTTINGGILQFAKTASLYNSTTARYTATNIIVNNGGTLALNVGGTGEFTSGNVDTLKALGTASGGFTSGSRLGLDTTNAGGTFTYASVIGDTNSGANSIGFTKLGTGTLVLSGASTYTGVTTVQRGTLSVSTLANGGISSNIGASTNVAANLVLNGGVLQYTGAGASTDRLFSLQSSSSIDASGTAALNFTNPGAVGFNGGTTAKILTLRGSSTDANTLSAAIGDNTGTTSLNKTDAGTWVLAGANTYSGGTTVAAGALTLSPTGTLGTGNVTLADVTGVILQLNNAAAIADSATLTFGTSSAVQMNAAGSETLGSIVDSNTGITLNTPNTYTAADLNTFFGVSSFSGTETFTIAPVPEPATCAVGVLLVGVTGFSLLRRRRAVGQAFAQQA